MGWKQFCTDYRIVVGRETDEDIYIKCPFCGESDHSYHMGLEVSGKKYGCWRSEDHRGRDPARVIRELLGCKWDEARAIASDYGLEKVHQWEPKKAHSSMEIVQPPDEFREFGTDPYLEVQFKEYLQNRGLNPGYVIPRFNLRYATVGNYAYRLIIPVIKHKNWYCWTSRTISKTDPIRYKASSDDSPNAVTDFLLDYDNLTGGKALILNEGSFDAMAAASCMLPGIDSTCLFGKVMSDKQKATIIELAKLYDKVFIALDPDAKSDCLKLYNALSLYIPNANMLPTLPQDFGSTSRSMLRAHLLSHTK